jgi:polysaccharide export outer membrane protein
MSSTPPALSPNDKSDPTRPSTSPVPGASAQESAATASLNTKLLRRASGSGSATDLPLGPGDLIEITVFEVPELSGLKVRVSRPGMIVLPLLGEVPVAGMSPGALETDLRQRLSRSYMYDPHVTVFVHERNSQRISVIGAVRKGGVFELNGRLRVADALGMAEGLTDDADHIVYLFRRVPAGTIARAQGATKTTPSPSVPAPSSSASSTPASSGSSASASAPASAAPSGPSASASTPATPAPPTSSPSTSPGPPSSAPAGASSTADSGDTEEVMTAINLDAIANGSEDLNVLLEAGDVIQVPRAGSIYVGGSVAHPGSLPLKSKTTVHQAILAAGGATNVAALSDVRLYRTEANGHVEVITLDLDEFEAGKGSPDLEKNDVVIVGKSMAKAFFWNVYELFRGMFGVGVGL